MMKLMEVNDRCRWIVETERRLGYSGDADELAIQGKLTLHS